MALFLPFLVACISSSDTGFVLDEDACCTPVYATNDGRGCDEKSSIPGYDSVGQSADGNCVFLPSQCVRGE